MKLLILLSLFLVTVGMANQSQAEEHSENVCTSADQTICAHLGYHWGVPTSSTEAKFMFHVMTDLGDISDLKIKLWMDMGNGHGHGSSPVEIKDLGQNKFLISKAYFVMAGPWLVRAQFTLNGHSYNLDIPVNIEN